ncbi:MAG: UDP-glucose/GDP-mannose dehydrogenase family protein [Christensenellaceae bacterium]
MNISIIGTGYVGLVTGACFAEFGLNVICMDNDTVKIEQLKHNVMPIYEPGIAELVSKNVKEGRLRFTSNMKDTVENSSVIFIAVGTPPLEDGSADLQYVIRVAHDISAYLNEYKIIVNKSTVPVGTGKKVRNEIRKCLLERRVDVDFDVVSNPEFLREGLAIDDFTHPDRIILGTETQKAADIMCELYRHINTKEFPIVCTSIESAELIKYASNAFLAMKISYVNQIAELCENVGADIHDVTKGIGLDKRIGTHTLQAGPGFGGSCFPKDTRALIKIGNEAGVNN